MGLYESVRTVASASGEGAVDWDAVAGAAKSATAPGTLDLTAEERAGYASDVRDARTRLREVSGLAFDVPETVVVQNRHHWIDANVATFRRVMAPLDERPARLAGLTRVVNTGSMATALSFLANNVLGQYDPLLLAEADAHELYFVHPNVVRVADSLEVDRDRFRRWIAFHEVTHAAEFGAAPWLTDYLETRVRDAVEQVSEGRLGFGGLEELAELNAAMTAVEGYAELLMDRAFDREYDDLREKLEARRRGGDPLTRLLRRLLGLGMKRRQYERGAAFFESVADERGLATAALVWEHPDNLPTDRELDDPDAWLRRVA